RVRDLPTMHIQPTYDPHRDLLELRGLERPACSNTPVPRGSHHISSLWRLDAIARRPGRSPWHRGSMRHDQHVDREVLRCPTFGRRASRDLSERRAELLLHEPLEGLARL